MSPELIGGLGVLALLILLTLGVRIGIALALVGLAGLAVLISPEAALIKSGVVAFDIASRYELGVLPLFLLMAHLCFAAGASRDFFEASAKLFGHRPGGLALASVGACGGFGAISGSSLATVATIGLVALPEMRKAKYDPALATGAIAAGGSIGSLVPPSAALIVFGILAEQSIGRLFTAAIVPAVTQAVFYMAVVLIVCLIRPSMGPRMARAPWSERLSALARLWDIGLLIALVVGGIALGWFSPTEAASIGCVGALAMTAWRGKLSFAAVRGAVQETLRTTGMIYLVVIGAIVFSTFIAAAGLAGRMAEIVAGLHTGPTGVVIAMVVIILLLGMFLDGLALMTLVIPIFLPIVQTLGLSPIWFGVVLVRAMEIGFVHPPVGMNVYIIHNLSKDIPLGTIFKGVIPFLIADMVHLAVLILVPATVLLLPKVLGA
jgi:C4-dicarboxylate transporter, DctM subunit